MIVDLNSRMFLGIGAQKCASTWLYDILADHPEVCLPRETKEIDFFSYWYDFGFQWYERQFEMAPRNKIIGEVSPSYFHNIAVPHRVAAYNPDTLVIVFLREPVARLISNHKHEVRTGHIRGPDLSLENGLRNNPSYIEQGKYATHLARWFEALPQEQFLIMTFDEIVANTEEMARRIYDFLSIDPSHRSRALHLKSNKSYVTRFGLLEAGKNRSSSLIRAVGLERAWISLADMGLRNIYRRLNRQPPDTIIPPADPATIAELKETFSVEVAHLEKILGRSLESWR